MDQPPYTSADFHTDVQRQLVNAAVAAFAETKLEWAQVAPFLSAARSLCRDDLRLNGRLAIHGEEYDESALVPAEEAYLSLSVRDRDDATEWLSQTYWLSDIVLSDEDPARVTAAITAIERSLDKLRAWLTERATAGAVETQAAGETEAPPAVLSS